MSGVLKKTKEVKTAVQSVSHPIKLVHIEKAEGMSGVLKETKEVKTAIPRCFTPYKVSSQRES